MEEMVSSPCFPRRFKLFAEKLRNAFSFRGTLSYEDKVCKYEEREKRSEMTGQNIAVLFFSQYGEGKYE